MNNQDWYDKKFTPEQRKQLLAARRRGIAGGKRSWRKEQKWSMKNPKKARALNVLGGASLGALAFSPVTYKLMKAGGKRGKAALALSLAAQGAGAFLGHRRSKKLLGR